MTLEITPTFSFLGVCARGGSIIGHRHLRDGVRKQQSTKKVNPPVTSALRNTDLSQNTTPNNTDTTGTSTLFASTCSHLLTHDTFAQESKWTHETQETQKPTRTLLALRTLPPRRQKLPKTSLHRKESSRGSERETGLFRTRPGEAPTTRKALLCQPSSRQPNPNPNPNPNHNPNHNNKNPPLPS